MAGTARLVISPSTPLPLLPESESGTRPIVGPDNTKARLGESAPIASRPLSLGLVMNSLRRLIDKIRNSRPRLRLGSGQVSIMIEGAHRSNQPCPAKDPPGFHQRPTR